MIFLGSPMMLGLIISHALTVSADTGPTPLQANLESARQNGYQIFNAIHAAMRQWGSSLDHNGMSFFPATIPEGVSLYHGTYKAEAITGTEWLAFEIEHAEIFASFENLPSPEGRSPEGIDHSGDAAQAVIAVEDEPPQTGYLHIYRTTRPQRLLYIDGMSGGKTQMGTLDTQDILLRNRSENVGFDEWRRAAELCEIAQRWGIDGILRMEAGFEIIKCNMSDGMELISANRRPTEGVQDPELTELEYVRAVAQRYWDIGASRVLLDFSRMTSAFFYPINLTNPDAAFAEQPRLVYPSWQELARIKSDVAYTLLSWSQEEFALSGADWQGVTDIVVSRYANRLRFMAEKASLHELRFEVDSLLNTFIDYSVPHPNMTAAFNRCAWHFLSPIVPRSWQDRLIWAALEIVTSRICGSLFTLREIVATESVSKDGVLLSKARAVIVDLMALLRWHEWKRCGPCESDRVCFVAMWPNGSAEDHYSPRCLNKTEVLSRQGYWD
ncbi:hypothetical protein DL769_004191 [Monosporascus sp. CRB-8-3]|nr:hypothetical protein DL769_004191 [Monosporascus sp. CRB-8-3]